MSNYAAFSNSPIWKSDVRGDTDRVANYYYNFDPETRVATKAWYKPGDGDKKGSFKKEWELNKAFLKKTSSKDLIEFIETTKETVWIVEGTGLMQSFYQKTITSDGTVIHTIVYNPRGGLEVGEVRLSPASVLSHEADHAVDAIAHPKEHNEISGKPDPQYRTAEERKTITGREQKLAQELGEVKKGTPTRKGHNGTIFRADNFNSNKKESPVGSGMPIGGSTKQ